MGVKAGAQGELEGLAGDRLGGAIHDDVTSRETLVEVSLLQVQPKGKCRAQLHYILNSGFTNTSLGKQKYNRSEIQLWTAAQRDYKPCS